MRSQKETKKKKRSLIHEEFCPGFRTIKSNKPTNKRKRSTVKQGKTRVFFYLTNRATIVIKKIKIKNNKKNEWKLPIN